MHYKNKIYLLVITKINFTIYIDINIFNINFLEKNRL